MSKELKPSRINLVESSHHDLGWHKGCYDAEAAFTFDEINTALDLMRKDPKFTWTHECGGYIYSYLKQYPQRFEELARRVAEGRMDIGAGYTMPYTSFVTSEMLVRQFIYGKKWVEKTFPGCKSDVYYNTDIPGLGVQMPQIMAKAGVRYLYASRSWNFDGFRQNEFKQMEALDKTRINVFFMNHYGNFHFDEEGVPFMEKPDRISEKVAEFRQDMEQKHVGGEVPLLYSMDCCLPMDFTERFEKWNAYAEAHDLPRMDYSTMQQALDAIFTEDADLSGDVLTGEWPSKWFYENAASDDHTFMNQREAERLLRTTEVLAVIRAIVTESFSAYPAEKLEEAWRAADHACHGYAPEGSVEDFKRTYQKAFDIAKELYEENITWLVRAVRTDRTKGTLPFVVFNNLSWVRDDVVVMDKPEAATDTFRIVGSDGKEAAYQLTDGNKLVFVAEGVPAMGYKTYYIRPGEAPAASGGRFETGALWTETFSNRFYAVTPVVQGGALESILDLENQGKSLFSTEKFKIGELYDFQYDGMGAGEQLNMWQPHKGVSQRNYFGKWTCVEAGPVRTVFETCAPSAARGAAVLRFTVYETIKRVDFDMKLDMDSAAARQLRLMFPVNAGDMFGSDGLIDPTRSQVTYEVPFGAVNIGDEMLSKFSRFNDNTGDPNFVGGYTTDPTDYERNSAVRPREVQNWMQAVSKESDFSVVFSSYNLGWDYQDPTAAPVRTPVLQPIMISTSKACHWLYGHWLQPGEHHFHFSMTSGTASDTAGHRLCVGVNNPLDARVQDFQTRMLPETDRGLGISRDNVVVTAIKKAEDDDRHIVVRWYESEGCGCSSDVTITLPGADVENACRVSLIERPVESTDIRAEEGALVGPVAPWSIETAMVEVNTIR